MRKQRKLIPPPSPIFKGGSKKPTASLWEKAVPLLVLAASFLICFWPWFRNFNTKVFLSLDMTFAYYPLYHWVHEHLAADKLPLISDLAYNGAPVAAIEMVGILSPALWLLHVVDSFNACFNLLFLAPMALYLFGTYFLGRRLGLSRSGSVLLAFLWTYNGHQMAQLDHLNVTWAHAFFPWAFMALIRYRDEKKAVWLLLAGFLWGLNLLSGHPQIVFLEGLFFLFWIFLSTLPPLKKGGGGVLVFSSVDKIKTASGLVLSALITASPQILFTMECRGGEGFNLWDSADQFFHSWTPLNFFTLVFPWFFGKEQFDRAGGDYWWQYQFPEMQVAFGIVGLFLILLFFLGKSPQRRWIGWTALFGLLMAFGKFFFLYPIALKLPFFSFFRDPARYWFLITWAVGLGAAYAWDEWFNSDSLRKVGSRLSLWITGFALGVLFLGWFFLHPGRSLVEGLGGWFIQHFIMGDSLHTQPLSTYLARIPEKLDALAFNLDLRHPRVFWPILFIAGLAVCLFNRLRWNITCQRIFLLTLLFADLMAFRMPLGDSFVDPTTLPGPAYPAPQNRSLVLLSGNVSPQPKQYAEMAFPNWNFISGRPNIAIVANPHLPQYNKILADLGWFSWVYKNRNSNGFIQNQAILAALGVDQIVSDIPLNLPKTFKTIQNHYPYVYQLSNTNQKVMQLVIKNKMGWQNYSGIAPTILNWNETRISLLAVGGDSNKQPGPDTLILQKTLIPGWHLLLNGKIWEFSQYPYLMAVQLLEGKNVAELTFDPVSLHLSFFLFFLVSAALSCLWMRRRLT